MISNRIWMAMACAAALAACGGEKKDAAASEAPSENAQDMQAASQGTERPAQSQSMTAPGKVANLPAWFPSDFPFPKTTQMMMAIGKQENDNGEFMTLLVRNDISPAETYAFYEKALPESGFEIVKSIQDFGIEATSESGMDGYTHVGLAMSAYIDEGRTQMYISLSPAR